MAGKKRSNGEGSISKAKRNGYDYWAARYTQGVDKGTGKQIQKTKYFKKKSEAVEFLRNVEKQLSDGLYTAPDRITLAQWIDIWLDEYCVEQKYLTKKHYRASCETHIKPCLGAVKLQELSAPMIQSFYNKLANDGKTNVRNVDGTQEITHEPLAPKTIKNIHAILTKCLNTALKLDYIKINPTSKTTIPKVIRKEIKPLTDEQVKLFLQNIRKDKYENALKTIIFTGMREAECLGLTWNNVDFKTSTITISQQLQRRTVTDGGYQLAPTKSGKARYIVASPYVMQILKEQKNKQRREMLSCPSDIWEGFKTVEEQKKSLVFTNETGGHLNCKGIWTSFKKTAEEIGCPEARVHDLRHTYAVLSLQNGDSPKVVQETLGHASASFTLDIYGHVSERMRKESADKMQAYIEALNA